MSSAWKNGFLHEMKPSNISLHIQMAPKLQNTGKNSSNLACVQPPLCLFQSQALVNLLISQLDKKSNSCSSAYLVSVLKLWCGHLLCPTIMARAILAIGGLILKLLPTLHIPNLSSSVLDQTNFSFARNRLWICLGSLWVTYPNFCKNPLQTVCVSIKVKHMATSWFLTSQNLTFGTQIIVLRARVRSRWCLRWRSFVKSSVYIL